MITKYTLPNSIRKMLINMGSKPVVGEVGNTKLEFMKADDIVYAGIFSESNIEAAIIMDMLQIFGFRYVLRKDPAILMIGEELDLSVQNTKAGIDKLRTNWAIENK